MNSFAIQSLASLYDLYCVDPHELATINKHANTLEELLQVALDKGDHLFYKLYVYSSAWGYSVPDLMHLCKDVCTAVRQSHNRYMEVGMWKPVVVERYVALEDLEKFRADPSSYEFVNKPDSKYIRAMEYSRYAQLKHTSIRSGRKLFGQNFSADEVENPCCCWFDKEAYAVVCHNEAKGQTCDRLHILSGLIAKRKLQRALRRQARQERSERSESDYESDYSSSDSDYSSSESDSESDYSSDSESESDYSSSESDYSSSSSDSDSDCSTCSERSAKRRRHH